MTIISTDTPLPAAPIATFSSQALQDHSHPIHQVFVEADCYDLLMPYIIEDIYDLKKRSRKLLCVNNNLQSLTLDRVTDNFDDIEGI